MNYKGEREQKPKYVGYSKVYEIARISREKEGLCAHMERTKTKSVFGCRKEIKGNNIIHVKERS